MGADVFSRKCGAHNVIVPMHSSCPVCVSAKRTQLHAANLAHMPRYLFEQQLDVKADATGLASGPCVLGQDPQPVRSFMKSHHIQGTAADVMAIAAAQLPCEKRWSLNLKTSGIILNLSDYTGSARIIMDYIDSCPPKTTEYRHKHENNMSYLPQRSALEYFAACVRIRAFDEFRETRQKMLVNETSGIVARIDGWLVQLYEAGQRVKVLPAPVQPPAHGHMLNFPSTYYYAQENLNSSTRELLRQLDKYEGAHAKLRTDHEAFIRRFTAASQAKQHGEAVTDMADALWNALTMDNETRRSTKVRDQFMTAVEWLYHQGQRLVVLEVPQSKPQPSSGVVALYNYLTTSSKELYHKQSLLEASFDRKLSYITRNQLISDYAILARETLEFYCREVGALPGSVYREFLEYLADQYLEGVRR